MDCLPNLPPSTSCIFRQFLKHRPHPKEHAREGKKVQQAAIGTSHNLVAVTKLRRAGSGWWICLGIECIRWLISCEVGRRAIHSFTHHTSVNEMNCAVLRACNGSVTVGRYGSHLKLSPWPRPSHKIRKAVIDRMMRALYCTTGR